MTTIADLQRISAKALSERVLKEQDAKEPTYAIVDVRDNDYIGGHIKGSSHFPIDQLDAMMPTLVRRVKDKQTVVFHCVLSQQRGPSAALKYLRERDALLKSLGSGGNASQEVVVLDGGFMGWQQAYGGDARLTESWVKDLWENY